MSVCWIGNFSKSHRLPTNNSQWTFKNPAVCLPMIKKLIHKWLSKSQGKTFLTTFLKIWENCSWMRDSAHVPRILVTISYKLCRYCPNFHFKLSHIYVQRLHVVFIKCHVTQLSNTSFARTNKKEWVDQLKFEYIRFDYFHKSDLEII